MNENKKKSKKSNVQRILGTFLHLQNVVDPKYIPLKN